MSTPASPGFALGVATPQTPQSGGAGMAPLTGSDEVPATPRTPSSGASAMRRRRELGDRGKIFTDLPATPASAGTQVGIEATVWGTSVTLEKAQAGFRRFFSQFAGDDGKPLYPALIEELAARSETDLNVNLANLASFDPELYRQLLTYPQEMVPCMDFVLLDMRQQLLNPTNDPEKARQLDELIMQSRPFNVVDKKSMRDLNPEDMDTMVSIKGMVIRCGGVLPEMARAFFRCAVCEHEKEVEIDEGVINEPQQCDHCQSKRTYRVLHNRCRFNDKQAIKVQETPDSIPEGETPHHIMLYAWDALVDAVKPGDRVEITGIYKAIATKVNPRRSTLNTVYKTYVDAMHFKKTDNARLSNEADEEAAVAMDQSDDAVAAATRRAIGAVDATSSQMSALEAQIVALSQEPDIYEKLTRSLAPSIWELEDVKKGILCLLFGGSGSDQGAASGKFRGEINVLMCGDPGTSKSQLLQYVHKLAPRGIYTSGKGSSAVGLTASVVKDPETKEMVLESGALVLSDRGVCCIDEFDKMSDATRSILHEVMEQQTVSIAKAGIVCTLNARTSILASANPKESRYNPKLSVVENVQIMPTLLSRFDLIYLVLDQPNEHKDRKLAKHLVGLYHETVDRSALGDIIDMRLLTAYISYARRHCRPELSDAAQDLLIEFYTSMRLAGVSQRTITATPRQLEALIRLSEALAKMSLSKEVTEAHVHEAKRLMDVATQRVAHAMTDMEESAATDPTTGRIDMDLLQTGHSTREREQMEQLASTLGQIIADNARVGGLKLGEARQLLSDHVKKHGGVYLKESQFDEALQSLVNDGLVRKDHSGTLRMAS